MHALTRLAVVAALLLSGASLPAQKPEAQRGQGKIAKPGAAPDRGKPPKTATVKPSPDPFDALIPPDVVMANQNELGLSDAQRQSLRQAVQESQGRFADLQWRLSAETERLGALLREPVIDERQVLEQVDRVLALERDAKRTKLVVLVRIRNTLTPEQQTRAAALWRRKS
jgi:Spy/CpxP family protein refolding chaperone